MGEVNYPADVTTFIHSDKSKQTFVKFEPMKIEAEDSNKYAANYTDKYGNESHYMPPVEIKGERPNALEAIGIRIRLAIADLFGR